MDPPSLIVERIGTVIVVIFSVVVLGFLALITWMLIDSGALELLILVVLAGILIVAGIDWIFGVGLGSFLLDLIGL